MPKKKDKMQEVTDVAPDTELENETTKADETEDSQEGESSDYSELARQIKSEFEYGIGFMRPKWTKWVTRLKLYNNQMREKAAVGDPLLFTTFQTVFASLYDDHLQQTWQGREEGDEETAENLNQLSEHDVAIMEMPDLTYDWEWDACFFGRSLVDMSEFDRDEDKTTTPFVIDPLTMIRDPKAVSVRGKKGRGAIRFLGYQIAMTRNDINALPDFMNKDKLKFMETQTEIQANHELRQQAQGFNAELGSEASKMVGENKEYIFYVWYTHYEGKKVRVLTDANFSTIFRMYVPKMQKYFPLADMAIYPMPGSWDGVSIPDLVEDKQRKRAAMLNAATKSVQHSQNPSYLFNANAVNQNELGKTEFGNLVPVNGDPNGKVVLMPRDVVKQDVQWILEVLDGAAQRATATPEIQQGATSSDKKTFGEINLVASKVDTRYSLTAKLFASGFQKFWQLWYWNYKNFFAESIDEKIIRISGTNGAKWRKLTRENIISEVDPDVEIESKVIVESKRFNDLNVFSAFHGQATADPRYNVHGGLVKLGKLSGLKTDEMNILFRKTTDELEAEKENELLSDDKLYDGEYEVKVTVNQNHDIHIEEHGKASETKAKAAHIAAHNAAKLMMRDNPTYNAMDKMNNASNPMNDPNSAAIAGMAGMSVADKSSQVAPTTKAM